MRSMSTLMRAMARFFRSMSAALKMRMTASLTFRYSSSDTNSRTTIASRGMIARPPPQTILNPCTPFWMRGMKPRSWMPVIATSESSALKATLNLRGSSWVSGLRSQKRANAPAYGVTSKSSPAVTPAHGSAVTLRTVFPQASRVESPVLASSRSTSGMRASGMWWNWKFWRVVMCPLRSGAWRSASSPKASICSGVTPPKGSFTRVICTFACRWP